MAYCMMQIRSNGPSAVFYTIEYAQGRHLWLGAVAPKEKEKKKEKEIKERKKEGNYKNNVKIVTHKVLFFPIFQ